MDFERLLIIIIDRNVARKVKNEKNQVDESNGKRSFSYGVYFSAGVTKIWTFKLATTFDIVNPSFFLCKVDISK